MKKQSFQTKVIYILTAIIVVLLIVINRMNYRDKVELRKESVETVEETKDSKAHKLSPETPPPLPKGTIGLIIDDFGYRNDDVSNGFLKLNAKLTYAVIPGHKYSTYFGKKAINKGYEIIVHMPLENLSNFEGEDEFVLRTSMNSKTLQDRLRAAFGQIPAAIGMNNHQGSKASADKHVMSNIARVLKDKDLFFIDSRTTTETVAESTMEVYNVPTSRRNVFLDNESDENKITAQMLLLSQMAEEKGSAIGIGHVRPKTLKVLQKQIPALQKKGFKFEFVSNMLH
jgi:polysaccharide deacetylase 2 family uncharacterized protein YibQ